MNDSKDTKTSRTTGLRGVSIRTCDMVVWGFALLLIVAGGITFAYEERLTPQLFATADEEEYAAASLNALPIAYPSRNYGGTAIDMSDYGSYVTFEELQKILPVAEPECTGQRVIVLGYYSDPTEILDTLLAVDGSDYALRSSCASLEKETLDRKADYVVYLRLDEDDRELQCHELAVSRKSFFPGALALRLSNVYTDETYCPGMNRGTTAGDGDALTLLSF